MKKAVLVVVLGRVSEHREVEKVRLAIGAKGGFR